METRVKIDEKQLRKVFSDLQEEGYTMREISDEIGTNFRNALYKGSSLSDESFKKLRRLYGESIPHQRGNYIDGEGFKEKLELNHSIELAELIGLILGDGHLRKECKEAENRHISNHYLDICLGKEEKEIIKNTKELLEKCLKKEPTRKDFSNSEAVSLRVYGKEIVKSLEATGLECGDKIKNQVGVPKWIKNNKKFEKGCLRGLIDSDGSVYKREDGYRVVYFKNHSEPLLEDFKSLSSDLGFKPSSAGPKAVQIASQDEVKDFLERVQPRKRP